MKTEQEIRRQLEICKQSLESCKNDPAGWERVRWHLELTTAIEIYECLLKLEPRPQVFVIKILSGVWQNYWICDVDGDVFNFGLARNKAHRFSSLTEIEKFLRDPCKPDVYRFKGFHMSIEFGEAP